MSSNWPKEVPILDAHKMIQGEMHSQSGNRHCLLGWGHTVFPNCVNSTLTGNQLVGKAREALIDAVKEVSGPCRHLSVIHLNDVYPRRVAARVWNRAMYLLGYTEGNPESKPLTPEILE